MRPDMPTKRVTIGESMELAGHNMLANLSPEQDYLPWWEMEIDHELRARCLGRPTNHNIGRWWDAMLRLEAATGFAIPPDLEAAMLRHLRGCLDNPLGIVYGPTTADGPGGPDAHSQREVLLSLALLVRHRPSEWATEASRRIIEGLEQFFPAEPKRDPYIVVNHGRALEGMVELYRATGDRAALELADRHARFHFEVTTRPDGSVPNPVEPDAVGHTHSLLNTYRGILLFGEVTRQREYIDRIEATYRVTLRNVIKRSGFISHNWLWDRDPESASAGDVAQIAMWLARNGHVQYLDDAERIVRARIIPSQITEPLGLTPIEDTGGDECADLDARALGAYGGCHTQMHGGKHPTTDVTAADLHTLCDLYEYIAEQTERGLRINFHFNYEDARVAIRSERDESARLTIVPNTAQPLWIRVPRWTPEDSLTLTQDGHAVAPLRLGDYLYVDTVAQDREVVLEYALPVFTESEPTNGVDYQFTWRGDEVIGVTPNADLLPFYPTAT